MAHPFFSSVDWARLERRELPAPFVPAAFSDAADATAYVDSEFTSEPVLDSVPKPAELAKIAENARDAHFEGFTFVDRGIMQ